LITFRMSCRRSERYCGHARLCVCVCPRPHTHTTARRTVWDENTKQRFQVVAEPAGWQNRM